MRENRRPSMSHRTRTRRPAMFEVGSEKNASRGQPAKKSDLGTGAGPKPFPVGFSGQRGKRKCLRRDPYPLSKEHSNWRYRANLKTSTIFENSSPERVTIRS